MGFQERKSSKHTGEGKQQEGISKGGRELGKKSSWGLERHMLRVSRTQGQGEIERSGFKDRVVMSKGAGLQRREGG